MKKIREAAKEAKKAAKEAKKAAKFLFQNGYLVMPFSEGSEKELPLLQRQFYEALLSFLEYKNPTDKTQFVYGGFAALGNAGSFHNPFVRKIRIKIMMQLIPMFRYFRDMIAQKDGVDKANYTLEQIIDRMMYRLPGQVPTAEAAHRDMPPNKHAAKKAKKAAKKAKKAAKGAKSPSEEKDQPENTTLGGWVNFDSREQIFTCAPCSHKDTFKTGNGFAPIKGKLLQEYKANRINVKIPPGSIFIFDQTIAHDVNADKKKYPSCRLFIGFALSPTGQPTIPNLVDLYLTPQAVVPLKSGQMPPMYASMHWVFHRKKLAEWAKIFQPELLEKRIVNSGKDKGSVYLVPPRTMPSLSKLGYPLYEPYSEDELRMYAPGQLWWFQTSDGGRVKMSL